MFYLFDSVVNEVKKTGQLSGSEWNTILFTNAIYHLA